MSAVRRNSYVAWAQRTIGVEVCARGGEERDARDAAPVGSAGADTQVSAEPAAAWRAIKPTAHQAWHEQKNMVGDSESNL